MFGNEGSSVDLCLSLPASSACTKRMTMTAHVLKSESAVICMSALPWLPSSSTCKKRMMMTAHALKAESAVICMSAYLLLLPFLLFRNQSGERPCSKSRRPPTYVFALPLPCFLSNSNRCGPCSKKTSIGTQHAVCVSLSRKVRDDGIIVSVT